ncbi:MAG TPA: hypothetical protein VN704_07040 [Verrucomicrobiae bacterium]|nr:hypothetical protein [Verrucomicrobiae bacterium]
MTTRIVQGIDMSIFSIFFAMVQTQFPKNIITDGQGTFVSMFSFEVVVTKLIFGGNIINNFG